MSPEPVSHFSSVLDPRAWIVIRLDGRNFSARSAAYRRPFDPAFHAGMRQVTETLLAETPAAAAHTASDEVSLIFVPGTDWFGGRYEKWLSTCASVTGAALTRHLTRLTGLGAADARAFALPDLRALGEYLSERLYQSRRNCRNGYVYFGLRAQGLSPKVADTQAKQIAARGEGFIPEGAADWERYGAFLRYLTSPHTGTNPLTGQTMHTTRRRPAWSEISGMQSVAILLAELAADPRPGR